MIEQAIFKYMSSSPSITGFIGSGNKARVYPVKLPQNIGFPAVQFQRIVGTRVRGMQGSYGLVSVRFQFDIYSKKYSEAKKLSQAIRKLWDGYKDVIFGTDIRAVFLDPDQGPLYDDQTELYRIIQDYFFHYIEN